MLIAGAGHVRNDYGVPFYLQSADRQARILAVGLIEVRPGLDQAHAYAERWGGGQLPFDYVWFTLRAERVDPCVGLREKLHKSKSAE